MFSRLGDLRKLTHLTPEMKFYITYSIKEAKRHKCNTCLGICSVFIVVVISALCYTLVDNAAIVFLREAEQIHGEYDLKVSPNGGALFNYSLIASLMDDKSITLHTPRIIINQSVTQLFTPNCYETVNTLNSMDNPYDPETQCASILSNYTQCIRRAENLALWVIDFDREWKMKLGRQWNQKYKPNKGEAVIYQQMADALYIEQGSTVYLTIPINTYEDVPLLQNLILTLRGDTYNAEIEQEIESLLYEIENKCQLNHIPLTVNYITNDKSLGGRFPEDHALFDVVIGFEHFTEMFLQALPPKILNKISKLQSLKQESLQSQSASDNNDNIAAQNLSAYHFVNRVFVNIDNRVSHYLSTNYQNIQRVFVPFASSVRYYVGWAEVDVDMDLLNELDGKQQTMLSLGIVLDLIIFVLILLSVFLLYSLLVISVESTTFTIGIMRMIGMSRIKLVLLLESSALSYAIPAWILGLSFAQLLAYFVLDMLGSSASYDLDKTLTVNAVLIATFVGIFIDLIASILPTSGALSQSLQQSLDIHHSKTAAVEIKIDRSSGQAFSSDLFCINLFMVMFGWFIYYFLPQSVLNGDLELSALMLFSLLLAMLFGFVLIGLNVQHFLEKMVSFLVLEWWEKRPIPDIVKKNLTAHRIRNRKTALMYAFSLAFIFLVTVMISTNLEVLKIRSLREYGSKLFCWTFHAHSPEFHDMLSNSPYILDYALKPGPIWDTRHSNQRFYVSYVTARSNGRYFAAEVDMYPTTPNFASVAEKDFIIQTTDNWMDSTLSSTEQLFTAAGSQRALIGTYLVNKFRMKSRDKDTFMVRLKDDETGNIIYVKLRSAEWFSMYPFYNLFSRSHEWHTANVIVPFTTLPRLFGKFNDIQSMEDLWFTAILIKFKANVVNSEVDILKGNISDYCYSIHDYRLVEKEVAQASSMLDLIFSFMTYAALFLCLFSLVSSMFANVMEQSKEIGILRSMGVTQFEINKIYIYEALILILSSTLLGFIVGAIQSYVIIQQQILFSQFPIAFTVPSSMLFAVVNGALFTSVASVYFPLKILNKKQISQNLRDLFI